MASDTAAARVTAATGKCDVKVKEDASLADVVRRKGDDEVLSINGLFRLMIPPGLGRVSAGLPPLLLMLGDEISWNLPLCFAS